MNQVASEKALCIIFAFLFITTLGMGQEILLYPGAVPNSIPGVNPEKVDQRETGGRFISNTAIPTLTVFMPKYPNRKAVIICPGGGYRGTAFDKEGILVAESLNMDSITAFVLKYRIPQDQTSPYRSMAPLQDAQQAIRHVRTHAKKYRIDANKIGMMGFSAGGHLAATAATHYIIPAQEDISDSTSLRPDFVALIYPVISFTDELTHMGSRNNLIGNSPTEKEINYFSNEKHVTSDSPPAFLVHAADDRAVPIGNSLAYYEACLLYDVPAEMHLYPFGGHGFGLYNPSTPDSWIDRFKNWLITQ